MLVEQRLRVGGTCGGGSDGVDGAIGGGGKMSGVAGGVGAFHVHFVLVLSEKGETTFRFFWWRTVYVEIGRKAAVKTGKYA